MLGGGNMIDVDWNMQTERIIQVRVDGGSRWFKVIEEKGGLFPQTGQQ